MINFHFFHRQKFFSKDEDKIIMKKMAEIKTNDHQKKFLKIAKILGRQPEAVAKRYDVLMTSCPSMDHRGILKY